LRPSSLFSHSPSEASCTTASRRHVTHWSRTPRRATPPPAPKAPCLSNRAEGRSTAELGASGVEYGILIAAIAALIIGVVFVLAQFVHDNYNTACTTLQSPMAGD